MFQFLQDHPRISRFLDILGAIVLVNTIAVLVALPVVTLAPVVAATFAYMSRVARNANVDLAKDFFGVLRPLFLRSWLLVAISALVWGGAAAVFFTVQSNAIPFGGIIATLWLLAAALWLMVSFYLWPALVLIDGSLPDLLRLSVRLTLGHLPWSLGLLAAVIATAAVALQFPILLALGAFSGLALLISAGTLRIMQRYVAAPA